MVSNTSLSNNEEDSNIDFETLLAIEKLNSDQETFRVKKMYVDIVDDLNAGILLGQIIYWYLPSEETGQTKLRVEKEGKLWLAKKRTDWWEEIRLSERQFDRAFNKIMDKGLAVKDKFMFNGQRTMHIRLKIDNLIEAVNDYLQQKKEEIEGQAADKIQNKEELPNGEGGLPNSETGLPESVRPITKSTTETFTENTSNSNNNGQESEIPVATTTLTFKKATDKINPIKEAESNVRYYLRKYEQEMEKKHPNLKHNQWEKVFRNIMKAEDLDYDKEFYLYDHDKFKRVVDQHFQQDYDNCDYNILHFVSGRIMINRYYEVERGGVNNGNVSAGIELEYK